MSSCLSLNSRPISFSALCIMSLVMRPGVGDGRGEGIGVGVGVCAIAFNGRFATVSPAAPAAGRSLTKARRLIELRFDFSIESSLVVLPTRYRRRYTQEPSLTVGLLTRSAHSYFVGAPYFIFTTFALPVR